MSRYIDADALHKAYIELRNFKQDPHSGDWISLRAVPLTTVIRTLDEAPSIDIVRCKECRCCHRNYVDMTPPYQHDYCYKFSRYMNADDFCSYGERSSE